VDWVAGAGRFVSVKKILRTGCGDCVKVCLGGCFEIRDGKARVKTLATCMECSSCWYAWGQDAVNFRWPKGGRGFCTNWG
jgi:ferredoxin-like protein FixX